MLSMSASAINCRSTDSEEPCISASVGLPHETRRVEVVNSNRQIERNSCSRVKSGNLRSTALHLSRNGHRASSDLPGVSLTQDRICCSSENCSLATGNRYSIGATPNPVY
jgi:hypothetical protein